MPAQTYMNVTTLAHALDAPPGVSAVKYTNNMVTQNKIAANKNLNLPPVTYTAGNEASTTTVEDSKLVNDMLMMNMSGIEGIPYQFMDTVDRRIGSTAMGRKYTEKIVSRLPLLFLTPCKQIFMADANKTDRNTVTQGLMNLISAADMTQLLTEQGNQRYYTVEYDYDEYYKYLNCMLTSLVSFLGLSNQKITLNGQKEKNLGDFNWQDETNESFKTFFSSKENVVFYVDGLTSISENFGNETTESSLASQINGISDTVKEIKFLIGDKGNALANIIDGAGDMTAALSESLSGVATNVAGGIIGSLADGGMNTVLNGGKIVFPQIWSNSTYDRSYDITIKLRSPDHDSLSIFLNVLKPYCRILTLVLPRLMADEDGSNPDPNGYRSPFLVKAYCKGLFNIDMGIISSLSVTKGDECCWNDDGLPTQIDINLTITDLYSSLAMSGFGSTGIFKLDGISHVVNNTAYMDYLANMAGMNITEMESSKKIHLYYYLTKYDLKSIPSRIFTKFDKELSKIVGQIYKTF